MSVKPWTIVQLKHAMDKDLERCNNSFEYNNCRAICVKEMRELAENLTRKLTPCEVAILESL
jgi:hypothetical protein